MMLSIDFNLLFGFSWLTGYTVITEVKTKIPIIILLLWDCYNVFYVVIFIYYSFVLFLFWGFYLLVYLFLDLFNLFLFYNIAVNCIHPINADGWSTVHLIPLYAFLIVNNLILIYLRYSVNLIGQWVHIIYNITTRTSRDLSVVVEIAFYLIKTNTPAHV